MTYKRNADSWAAATTRAARAVGEGRLADLLGVSASRVRQIASPMAAPLFSLEQAATADIAAAACGAGTPHYAEFSRRLAAAGALRAPGWQVAFLRLGAPLRAAIAAVLHALAAGAQPQLVPVEGRAA